MSAIDFIPSFFGISIEAYFIIGILGIPVFFLSRLALRKIVINKKKLKIVTWTVTILMTPIVYGILIWLMIFTMSHYPSRDFDRKEWLSDSDRRYEYSDKLIENKVLIGKSKADIREMLGETHENADSLSEWYFYLGYKPEIGNIDPGYLRIQFLSNKVVEVSQSR